MSAFRLQTFDPDRRSGTGEPDEFEHGLRAARDESYRAGYLAGQAAATESHLEDQGRLTCELVEALSDAGLTNEAARMHVAASIAPMIEAIANAIAPALAEAGTVAEIGRVVAEAIDATPEARPRILCSSEVSGKLARLLEERNIAADIEEIPEFLPGEARIIWDQGYDHIDMNACIDRVRKCLASHLNTDDESEEDDRLKYA